VSIQAVVELGNGKQVWSEPLTLSPEALPYVPTVVLDED
jgi:hypothetical protein